MVCRSVGRAWRIFGSADKNPCLAYGQLRPNGDAGATPKLMFRWFKWSPSGRGGSNADCFDGMHLRARRRRRSRQLRTPRVWPTCGSILLLGEPAPVNHATWPLMASRRWAWEPEGRFYPCLSGRCQQIPSQWQWGWLFLNGSGETKPSLETLHLRRESRL